MPFTLRRRLQRVSIQPLCSLGLKAEMSWSRLWVSVISSEVCQHQCSKAGCTEWSWTAYQEGLQNSFTRMPISVLRDLKTPHIRITFLMLLWEMCHLEIIRYSIQSTTSITSVFTIIFWQKHSIRQDRAAWLQ